MSGSGRMPDTPGETPLDDQDVTKCPTCGRGREACEWCHDLARQDFEAICDCGLHDFGRHLLDCEVRGDKRWVVRQ